MGLRPELVAALVELGYEEATPIQAAAIPVLLQRRDVLGQAATGTGKTAAFALPALELLAEAERSDSPRILVLVPTRELAMQVSEAFHRYGRGIGARVVPVFGGQPIGRQIGALNRGADVVVATPGRALDHIARGTLALDAVSMVVLDEADEMLDMGFADDIEEIFGSIHGEHQTVLFSATVPPRITRIINHHLKDPERIQIRRTTNDTDEARRLVQRAYIVARTHKPAALGRVLDMEVPDAAIVFCRTRTDVDQLTDTMNGRGYRAEALHGGLTQEQRDKVMGRVRSGTTELLIATDVAARGLDIDHLTHVVNYDVPSAPESYVHRIGRVGRAGRDGTAITLADPREHRLLKNIERETRLSIEIESLPTVADLRARRMELTQATIREALLSEDLDRFRPIVESLTGEFDIVEVALAAVKLTHESVTAVDDDQEIPTVKARPDRPGRNDSRNDRFADRPDSRGRNRRQSGSSDAARIFISLGRSAGIRPGDLVGAIAGETSLSGRDVGSIEIADRFSLVEVPEAAAEEVIAAIRQTTIKGRRPTVRRERTDRFDGGTRPGGGDRPNRDRPNRPDRDDRGPGGGRKVSDRSDRPRTGNRPGPRPR